MDRQHITNNDKSGNRRLNIADIDSSWRREPNMADRDKNKFDKCKIKYNRDRHM